MNRLIKITTLFLLLIANGIGLAQNADLVEEQKIVVWSKVENGYQVQLIHENGHEYILKTPLEIVEQQQLAQAATQLQGLYTPTTTVGDYFVPEIQTKELIQSRLYTMNAGISMTYTDKVHHEIDRYLSNRRIIENTLGRSKYFLPTSERILNEMAMPQALKYLPLVESSFRPTAYSRAGARGIWQFMSSTARLYGLKVSRSTDHRLDPEKSTRAAFTFLNDLYQEFGDWNLALAAYNAGPGRVTRAIRMSGLDQPTFWDIKQYLPRETRNYVPRFMAACYVMEYSDQMGLLPSIDGYNEVKDLVENISIEKPKPVYSATKSIIPENATVLTYTVKSGDNLGYIAEWYDVQTSQLRSWNGISGNLIRQGQHLKIYVPENKEHIYKDINQLTFAQKQDPNQPSSEVMASKVDAIPQSKRNFVNYKIQSGDTLWDISRKNGISVNEIKQLNNITNTKNLKPGMVIKIREKS